MSEAIIVRGGKPVDTDAINASLLAMNIRMDNLDSKINSAISEVNNTLGGVPTNSIIITNGYYLCTRTGNYWISLCGGGGSSDYSEAWREGGSRISGGSGYVNSGTFHLVNGQEYYVTIGAGGHDEIVGSGFTQSTVTVNGGTSSFGTLIAANGGGSKGGAGGNPGASWSWSWNGFGNPTISYGDHDNATSDRALYYYPNNRTCSIIGSTRLYYGEGASGSSARNGNNGCCIVTYMD